MVTLRAVYPSGTKFKKIWQPIVKLLDTLPLKVNQDGLSIKQMSSDNNLMIVFDLTSTSFEEYYVEGGEALIEISSSDVASAIKRATREDLVELHYDPSTSPYFVIKYINKKTSVEREFKILANELPLGEELREPDVELEANFTMKPKDFRDIVADAKIVGDETYISAHEEESEIKVIANDVNKSYEATLTIGNPLLSLNIEKTAHSKYSVSHLNDASRAYQAAETVKISFGSDKPMSIEYDLELNSTLKIWIAPYL